MAVTSRAPLAFRATAAAASGSFVVDCGGSGPVRITVKNSGANPLGTVAVSIGPDSAVIRKILAHLRMARSGPSPGPAPSAPGTAAP